MLRKRQRQGLRRPAAQISPAGERCEVLRLRVVFAAVAGRHVELAVDGTEADPSRVVIAGVGVDVVDDHVRRAAVGDVADRVHADHAILRLPRGTRAARRRLLAQRVVDVHQAVRRELRIERDPEKAALEVAVESGARRYDRVHVEERRRRAVLHDRDPPRRLLADEEPPVGREGEGGGRSEAVDDERLLKSGGNCRGESTRRRQHQRQAQQRRGDVSRPARTPRARPRR